MGAVILEDRVLLQEGGREGGGREGRRKERRVEGRVGGREGGKKEGRVEGREGGKEGKRKEIKYLQVLLSLKYLIPLLPDYSVLTEHARNGPAVQKFIHS